MGSSINVDISVICGHLCYADFHNTDTSIIWIVETDTYNMDTSIIWTPIIQTPTIIIYHMDTFIMSRYLHMYDVDTSVIWTQVAFSLW